MIPEQLLDLIYTRHAQRERVLDARGFIEHVPRHFFRRACKSVIEQADLNLKITYVYDERRDITLIVDPKTKTVITNWLDFSNNKNVSRGRFRITS